MASVIGSAYDYYLSTYGSQQVSKYDTHKKEDLRKTFNQIKQLSKESPLFKVKMSDDVQKYAIDIKENARTIQNMVASLSENEYGIRGAFQKKIATSSQPEVATAEYVGANSESDDADGFELVVKQLATPQTNVGNFLKRDEHDFSPGSYSFDLNTNTNSYEFQYNVNVGDTNGDVQQKLARLVNNANIGLKADILSASNDMTSLRIESRQTGLNSDEAYLFQIVPGNTKDSMYAMGLLGIDAIAAPAENSSFLLNGVEHSSYSNSFTVNGSISISLHDTNSEKSPVVIGFKPGAEAVADDVQSLVNSYNNILHTAREYSGTSQSNEKLLADMAKVAKAYSGSFKPIGLDVAPDGVIDVNYNLLADSIVSEDAEQNLDVLDKFKNSLGRRADAAALDPMYYVSKTLVAYKNPGKNFVNPYETSIYSGMMLDRIC